MPSIRVIRAEQSSQATIGGSRATAADFYRGDSQAGAGTTQLGAAIYDHAERGEVSDAHARLAGARAEWTVALQERAQQAPPGDPNFASQFNEDLSQYLQKAGGYTTAAGQRAYQQGSAELAAHFVQAAGVYQARSMGEKAKLDYEKVANGSAMAVYNDPTQFDSALGSLKSAIYDPASSFARIGGQRDALFESAKERLALAAVQGTINISPELAQKQLADGKWNDLIAVEKRDALDGEIKQAIRAKEAEAERLLAVKEREERKRQEAVSSAIFDQIVLGKATAQDILKSNLPRSEKAALYSFLKAQSTEGDADGRHYGKGFTQTLKSIYDDDPANNPTEREIMLRVGKDLTVAGASQLRAELQGRRTTDGSAEAKMKGKFFEAMELAIEKSSIPGMPKDARGAQLFSQYQQFALPEYQRLREKGMSPQEIMAEDGPLAQAAQKFRRTPKQIMEDLQREMMVESAAPSTTVPTPGAKPPTAVQTKLEPPTPLTQEQYDQLPPGARYKGSDGKTRIKGAQ